jgi:ankyrin repeat protein
VSSGPSTTAGAEGDGIGAFEAAADAVCAGDLGALRILLASDPGLVRRRSAAAHHATLLHYVSANGVEPARQAASPANGPRVAELLLDRGADPDATCDAYGGGPAQTTLCLVVSSAGPLRARTEVALIETLCRGGAAANGIDDDGLPLWTAVTRGRSAAAEALVACGARVDSAVFAAALGDLAKLDAELQTRTDPRLDPDRLLEYALIYAAANGRLAVVEWLLARDPDLSVTEPVFGSTALGAARYHRHDDVAARLAAAGR